MKIQNIVKIPKWFCLPGLYDLNYPATKYNVDIDFYLNELQPESKVLEFGCGTGRVGLALIKAGFNYSGIEFHCIYKTF